MKLFTSFFLLFFFGMVSCDDQTIHTVTEDPSEESQIETSSEVNGQTASAIFHKSHEPKKQKAPFSDVVQVGDLYFLSGQIGMDHSTRELVSGGIEAETKQTLENIKEVLAQHDLKMNDVVKATVILDEITDFSTFNTIYTTYFPQRPARTTFAAEALARSAKIEIEVVASKAN